MRSFVLLLLLASACTRPAQESAAPANTDSAKAELISKGSTVFSTNCIACHNQDPKKDGPLGPAVHGSSRELIEARVMRAEYPAGHAPKRNTKVMVAMPHLKNDLDALTAYLNQN